MRLSGKVKDKLIIAIPILLFSAVVLALSEKGLLSIYLVIAIDCILFILGLTEGEYINKKLVFILLFGWLAIILVGITGMIYYYNLYGNNTPNFTLLGMHPSFFYMIIFFWIGNLLYISLGLLLLRDIWLSQEKWDKFVETINLSSSEENIVTEESEINCINIIEQGEY